MQTLLHGLKSVESMKSISTPHDNYFWLSSFADEIFNADLEVIFLRLKLPG